MSVFEHDQNVIKIIILKTNVTMYDNNALIILDLLLVNPAGFWGAMMDEMVGYMSGRGE